MRVHPCALTALALAMAAALSGAQEHSRQRQDELADEQVGSTIEFILRASMGSQSDRRRWKLAGSGASDDDKAIESIRTRLHAEGDRIMPSVDRLDALRALYARADDLAPLERDRAALAAEVDRACGDLADGTRQLMRLFRIRVAAGLPELMKRSKNDAGSYVRLNDAYEDYKQLRRVRVKVCQTLLEDRAAFERRQEEIRRKRARRAQLRWIVAGVLALGGGAVWFCWRAMRRRARLERLGAVGR
ncbi:MAG: hypothetical protein NTX64_10720 [Elusimicrobia bacterium]|nr:hypothetical protein [Elusimicrobiota bacterium]